MTFSTDRPHHPRKLADMKWVDGAEEPTQQHAHNTPAATSSSREYALGRNWRSFRNFARDNPAAMTSLGAGIMSGHTAAGVAQFGQHAQAAQDLRRQTQSRNKTVEFLRTNHPDLASMVEAGLPVAEAWRRLLAGWETAAPELPHGAQLSGSDKWAPRDEVALQHQADTRQSDAPAEQQAYYPYSESAPMFKADSSNSPVSGDADTEHVFSPSTQEAYDLLPEGVLYLDPGDGSINRK